MISINRLPGPTISSDTTAHDFLVPARIRMSGCEISRFVFPRQIMQHFRCCHPNQTSTYVIVRWNAAIYILFPRKSLLRMSDKFYVKLISADYQEFFLDREIACASSTIIRTMVEGQFREARDRIIRFPNISGYILERVVRYLLYKAQYSNSIARIPDFVIEPEVALELLIAAKYLDC